MTATQTQPDPMALVRQKVSAILLTDQAKQQIMPLLPVGVAIQQVVSEVNRAVVENPELLECTPVSVIMAVSTIVKWDLEIGQTAYLVPFNTKVSKNPDRWEKRAKAIRDWKGDIEMVIRSGVARKVDAKCVYANEPFKYEEGTNPYIEHHPIMDPVKRGAMVGAYAYAKLARYELVIATMSVDEIDAIRQANSKSWKDGTLPDWYARKTMVHQLTKKLPKNRALAPVLAEFEREEKEEEIPEAEFEVVADTPAAVAPAPTDPATDDQVKRLRDLIANPLIGEATRTKVTRRLERGIVYGLANTWIEALDLELKAKTDDDSDELPLSKSA